MPLLQRVTKDLVSKGFRRGILEGNSAWLVLGALALALRVMSKPEAPKVVTEKLKLGESLVVTHLPPPGTGRKARRARRANGAGGAGSSTDPPG